MNVRELQGRVGSRERPTSPFLSWKTWDGKTHKVKHTPTTSTLPRPAVAGRNPGETPMSNKTKRDMRRVGHVHSGPPRPSLTKCTTSRHESTHREKNQDDDLLRGPEEEERVNFPSKRGSRGTTCTDIYFWVSEVLGVLVLHTEFPRSTVKECL